MYTVALFGVGDRCTPEMIFGVLAWMSGLVPKHL